MKTKRQTRYICGKCEQSFDSKEACQEHEKNCNSTVATQLKIVYNTDCNHPCIISDALTRSSLDSLNFFNHHIFINGCNDTFDEKISVWTYCLQEDVEKMLPKLVEFTKDLAQKRSLFKNTSFGQEVDDEVKDYLNRLKIYGLMKKV